MLGQNKLTIKPVITNPAAMIFQRGNDSPRKNDDAPIPNMGTNKGAGATTAAGCFDNSQAQAPYPKSVFPQDCQSTPSQAPKGALAIEELKAGHPPSKMNAMAIKGGIAYTLAHTT